MNNEQMPEPQPNSITTDDVLPSALLAQNPLLPVSGGNENGYYFIEVNKTWWQSVSKSIFRVHDEKFKGMRFEHKRCPFCNRITSIHPLHWLSHTNKCAPPKYSNSDLLRMQHYTIEEYDKKNNGFIGR